MAGNAFGLSKDLKSDSTIPEGIPAILFYMSFFRCPRKIEELAYFVYLSGGYVSLVGLLSKEEGQNLSMIVDEIFSSPEDMAENLQWFYENREILPQRDYDDICKLDNELPDSPRA